MCRAFCGIGWASSFVGFVGLGFKNCQISGEKMMFLRLPQMRSSDWTKWLVMTVMTFVGMHYFSGFNVLLCPVYAMIVWKQLLKNLIDASRLAHLYIKHFLAGRRLPRSGWNCPKVSQKRQTQRYNLRWARDESWMNHEHWQLGMRDAFSPTSYLP